MWGLINRVNMLVADKNPQTPSKPNLNDSASRPEPPVTTTPDHLQSERPKASKISIFGDMRGSTVNFSTTANQSVASERRHLPTTPLPTNIAANKAHAIPRARPAVFGLDVVLNEQQLQSFNFDLYKRLNEPGNHDDLTPTDQVSVNIKALETFMLMVSELTSILAIHTRPPPAVPHLDDASLGPFKNRKEENVLTLFFLQKGSLLHPTTLLEHKFNLENELFQLKAAVDVEILRDAPHKVAQIDRYFVTAFTTLDSAHELISRVRKQRYCLMEIRKNGSDIEAIRQKIRGKQQLETSLTVLSKLQERFKKFNMMMGQKFTVERACSIYNNLIIALVYCHKKLGAGMDLRMLQVYQHRLEDRLLYTRHKLNQNLFFELRMFKSCREKFSRKSLIEVVRQMVSIEEAAKSLLTHPHTQAKEVIEMLRKDERLLRGHFKDGNADQEIFGDPEVKDMVVGIYKELVLDGGRQLKSGRAKLPTDR